MDYIEIINNFSINSSSETGISWKNYGVCGRSAGNLVSGTVCLNGKNLKIVNVVYILTNGYELPKTHRILQKDRKNFSYDSFVIVEESTFLKIGLSAKNYIKFIESGQSLTEFKQALSRKYYLKRIETRGKVLLKKDLESVRRRLWMGARSRAKARNIPFNISEEDLEIPSTCPVLGIEIVFTNKVPSKSSPSIDRIVPEWGYVRGNVRVISNLANSMKSYANVEELIRFSKWVLENHTD